MIRAVTLSDSMPVRDRLCNHQINIRQATSEVGRTGRGYVYSQFRLIS